MGAQDHNSKLIEGLDIALEREQRQVGSLDSNQALTYRYQKGVMMALNELLDYINKPKRGPGRPKKDQ